MRAKAIKGAGMAERNEPRLPGDFDFVEALERVLHGAVRVAFQVVNTVLAYSFFGPRFTRFYRDPEREQRRDLTGYAEPLSFFVITTLVVAYGMGKLLPIGTLLTADVLDPVTRAYYGMLVPLAEAIEQAQFGRILVVAVVLLIWYMAYGLIAAMFLRLTGPRVTVLESIRPYLYFSGAINISFLLMIPYMQSIFSLPPEVFADPATATEEQARALLPGIAFSGLMLILLLLQFFRFLQLATISYQRGPIISPLVAVLSAAAWFAPYVAVIMLYGTFDANPWAAADMSGG